MRLDALEREHLGIVGGLESADEEIRRLAVERLLALPQLEAIPKLVGALGDESWRVRKAAVGRLLACSDPLPVVDALLAALADGENTGRRNSAVEALIALGVSAVPPLIEALQSDDVDVRKLVVDALAGIGDESAGESIIAVLEDSDPNVRGAAADALAVIAADGAAESLQRMAVCESEDRLVRLSALRTLARLEVPMQPGDLASLLDDSVLSPAGLALLGYCQGQDAVACLLKGLVSGARSSREAAMESLLQVLSRRDEERAQRLAEEIRAAALASDDLISLCIERLADANLSMRLILVQFLGIVRAPASVVPMLAAGRDEAIAEVVQSTLESMGEIAEGALYEAWSDLDTQLRVAACALLGRRTGDRGEARLLAALDDPDGELRAAAARALGDRRSAKSLSALVRRLESAALEDEFEAEEELAALVDALVALADPEQRGSEGLTGEAIVLLSARLDGANEAVRVSIATVLGRIGRASDAGLVATLLKDPSPQVRRAAVEALSRLEPGTSSEPLRLALADESAMVRISAAMALGASQNPQVLDDLKRLLRDEESRVRAAALRAIGAHCSRFGSDTAMAAAVALVEESIGSDGHVAMAALEALRQIGGNNAARAAVPILDRAEPELVQAAVSCVAQHGEESVVAELVSLISHPSWGVRADVIQTLADRRVVQAIPPILRRLETEQDSFVRDAILRALKRLED